MMNIRFQSIAAQTDADKYLRAQDVLRDLKAAYRGKIIDFQAFKTIRGQAIGGDVDGARKGLKRLLGR